MNIGFTLLRAYCLHSFGFNAFWEEKIVVYQALYGDYKYFVRSYEMFVSKVDHDKYPDVKQEYRFELIEE